MQKIILSIAIFLVSVGTFATTPTTANIKNLGAAWKTKQTSQPKLDTHDLTIVYGGADVSRRPTLAARSTTA